MTEELPQPGALVEGRYRIVDRIGEGGHGVVYRARREKLDRIVALKLIPRRDASGRDLERLRREVFHASGLTNSHTVTVYDYGTTADGHLYIAMEYLPGLNLGEWLAEFGALGVDQVTDALFKILDSLAEAHRHGIVHRDLKPGNIIVQRLPGPTNRLEIKLLDFGLSKYVGDSGGSMPGLRVTQEGRVYGTPQYMAPEQAMGEDVVPATDIYTVGLLGYEMLTGRPAFAGDSRQTVMRRQIRESLPELPEHATGTPLESFVLHCTQKSPADRFENAGLARKWLVTRHREFRRLETDGTAPATTDVDRNESPNTTSSGPRAATPPTGLERDLAPSDISRRIANLALLGRETELSEAMEWADEATREGGLLWLTGAPGVGKTRLLDELAERIRDGEPLVLRERFRRSVSPLETVRELFVPVVGGPDRPPRPRIPDVLDGETLDAAWRDLGLAESDDADPRRRTHAGPMFQGIARAISLVANERPLVLILDDFHHATGMAVGLVRRLAREVLDGPGAPVGLVLGGRSQELRADASIDELLRETTDAAATDDRREAKVLEVEPLGATEAQQFLDQVLPLEPGLREDLVEHASGNPLYLAQIVRYLVEQDLVGLGDERRYEVRDRSFELEELIPPSLLGLSRRRLRSLARRAGPDAHPLRALVRMAVLGDRFELSLLERVLDEEYPDRDETLAEALQPLERLDIIRETTISGEPALAFTDTMFRKAVLETMDLDDRDRRELHRLAARTKVRHLGADGDRRLSDRGHEIGHHLEKAGDRERAVDWYLRAASRYEELGAHASALADLRAAERLLSRDRPDSREELRRLIDVRMDVARLSRTSGKFGPAEDTLRAALEDAEALSDRPLEAELSYRLADVLVHRAAYNAAKRYFQKAERLYDRAEEPEEALRAALGQARVLHYLGDNPAARESYETLRERAVSLGADQLEGRALLGLARSDYESGDLDGAADRFETVFDTVESGTLLRGEADLDAGLVELYRTGPERAIEHVESALRVGRRSGDLLLRARSHLTAGMTLRRTPHIKRAERHADRARELYERAAHRWGLGKALLLEGELQWVRGDADRGAELAEDARQLHRDLDDVHGLALSLSYEGAFLNGAGRSEEARELLLRALAVGSRSQLELYRSRTLLFLGMVEEADHEVDKAWTYYRDAAQTARRQSNFETEMLAEISLAKLEIVRGDIDDAAETLREYRSRAEKRGHLYGIVFGMTGQAWVALHRGNEETFERLVADVRDYRTGEYALDLQLDQRLFRLAQLLARRESRAETTADLGDVKRLLRELGAEDFAHRLSLQLRTISESELTRSEADEE